VRSIPPVQHLQYFDVRGRESRRKLRGRLRDRLEAVLRCRGLRRQRGGDRKREKDARFYTVRIATGRVARARTPIRLDFSAGSTGARFARCDGMFQIGLVEQVRLTFDSLQAACEGHAAAAARVSRLSSHARLAMLGACALTSVLTAIALQGGRGWIIAASLSAAAAFAGAATYVGFDQQPRIYGHRVSSARLWVVCEKYRALLAEMESGSLDPSEIHQRRNALLQEAAGVFEQSAPDDRYTFEIAKRALHGHGARLTPSPDVSTARQA
jgi:hypothetical protein